MSKIDSQIGKSNLTSRIKKKTDIKAGISEEEIEEIKEAFNLF